MRPVAWGELDLCGVGILSWLFLDFGTHETGCGTCGELAPGAAWVYTYGGSYGLADF